MLEAARACRVRRVVYAGSSSAYGDTPVLPKVETMPPLPLSPYAVSKLAGELYCQMYARTMGVETVVLRYFNVFGPRQDPASQYAAVIPRFITAAMAQREPVVFGDGKQSRDFCFIDNVVEANLLAAERPRGRRAGVQHRLRRRHRAQRRPRPAGRAVRPQGDARVTRPSRAGDVKHSLADIGLAGTHLGYRPKVLFAEGLRRTVEWFRTAPA